MRKKLEEDLKIITLRMGNVILSINLARPQFFGVAAFIVVRAGRAPGAGKIGGRTLSIRLPILSPKRESGLEEFARCNGISPLPTMK